MIAWPEKNVNVIKKEKIKNNNNEKIKNKKLVLFLRPVL